MKMIRNREKRIRLDSMDDKYTLLFVIFSTYIRCLLIHDKLTRVKKYKTVSIFKIDI